MCEKMRKGLHGSLHFSLILRPCFRRHFFSGTSLLSLISLTNFFSLDSEFEFSNRRSSTGRLLQLQIGKWQRRRPTRCSPRLVTLMLLFSLSVTLSGTILAIEAFSSSCILLFCSTFEIIFLATLAGLWEKNNLTQVISFQ